MASCLGAIVISSNCSPSSHYHAQVCIVWGVFLSRASCQKGLICHASAWRVGPFWQDTLVIFYFSHYYTCTYSTHTHYSSSNVTHFIYSSIDSKCISLLHIPIVTNIAYFSFNKLRPRQNGQHFTDDILKCIFLKENIWILINILMNFVAVSRINNIPSLVQIMARRCRGASHYLNQWWLVYWHIYASLNLNELKVECSAYRESSELIKVGHGDTILCGEYRDSFPRHRLQRKPLVNDPGMQHGTCVTHVPWCMLGSLTHGSGENVPGIPPATRNFTYLARGQCIHV